MAATENFAKASWGWQLSQFQPQVGEWINRLRRAIALQNK